MNALLELTERVEKAEMPDRGLDRQIARAVLGPEVDPVSAVEYAFCARYTASIDAAMTLVPPDRKPMLIQQPCGRWEAAMLTTGDDDRDVCITENCATPALALTAAAPRSLAAQEVEPHAG